MDNNKLDCFVSEYNVFDKGLASSDSRSTKLEEEVQLDLISWEQILRYLNIFKQQRFVDNSNDTGNVLVFEITNPFETNLSNSHLFALI